ncbi:unnamed protein product [Calypogeia fissa]
MFIHFTKSEDPGELDDSGNDSEDHTIFVGVDRKDFAVSVNGEATVGVDTKTGEAVLDISSEGPVATGEAGTTNFDELTPTEVLFGHGTYPGITLSHLSPKQVNTTTHSAGANGEEDLCVPLNSPSCDQMQRHESPSATPVRKSNPTPAVGPTSMTKTPSYVILGVSSDHVGTPSSKYFKQFLKHVSSPEKTRSNDNEDGG